MKILAAADVHGMRPVYDWLLAAAAEHHVEAIVLAGDLLGCLDGFDTPEAAQKHESEILVSLLDTAKVPVLYIMGNDDLVELNRRQDVRRSSRPRNSSPPTPRTRMGRAKKASASLSVRGWRRR